MTFYYSLERIVLDKTTHKYHLCNETIETENFDNAIELAIHHANEYLNSKYNELWTFTHHNTTQVTKANVNVTLSMKAKHFQHSYTLYVQTYKFQPRLIVDDIISIFRTGARI